MSSRRLVVGSFPTPFDGEAAYYELGLHRLGTFPPQGWSLETVDLGTASAQDQASKLLHCGPDAILLPVYRDKVLDALALTNELGAQAGSIPLIWSGWTAHTPYISAFVAEGRSLDHPHLLVLSGEIEAGLPGVLVGLGAEASLDVLTSRLPYVSGYDPRDNRWVGRGQWVQVADVQTLPCVWDQPTPMRPHEGGAGWIELSRGCAYSCSFCIACSMKAGEIRAWPGATLEREVAAAYGAGVRMFGLLASATNYDLNSLRHVVKALQSPDIGPVRVAGTVHAKYLDDERLALLSALRWETMIVGVQTFSPEAQRLMRRKEEADRFAEAVTKLAAFGTPEVELILGLPGDTAEGFRKSVEFVLGLPVTVSVYRLRLDPWSIYLSERQSLGIEADFRNLGRVTSIPGFSQSEMEESENWLMGLGRVPWTRRAKRLMYDGRSIWPTRSFKPQN